jgi:hypothetical protein
MLSSFVCAAVALGAVFDLSPPPGGERFATAGAGRRP